MISALCKFIKKDNKTIANGSQMMYIIDMSNDEVTQQHGENKMTEQEIKKSPWDALEHHSNELTKKQFDFCVRESSYAALLFCAEKLSSKQFDFCVREQPMHALQFFSEKLTPDQFGFCVIQKPWMALEYCIDRLTPEQLDYCVRESPATAFDCCPHKLTEEQRKDFEKMEKWLNGGAKIKKVKKSLANR